MNKPTYEELAAQVDYLAATLKGALMMCEYQRITDNATYVSAKAKLESLTPQQALAEIRAEAGRAGFIAAINVVRLNPSRANHAVFVNQEAEKYSEQIRQGDK